MGHILLADDNPHAQRMGQQILAQEGHQVVTVADGDQAMEYLSIHCPDIVMADTRMPGPSGYEICQYVKETATLSKTRVVLLAGPLEPFDEDKAKGAGSDGVLQKPLDAAALISKVRALIGDGTAPSSPPKSENVASELPQAEASPRRRSPFGFGGEDPFAPRGTADTTEPGSRDGGKPAEQRRRSPFNPFHEGHEATQPAAPPPAPSSDGSRVEGRTQASPGASATSTLDPEFSSERSRPGPILDNFSQVVQQALKDRQPSPLDRGKVRAAVKDAVSAATPSIIETITDRVVKALKDS